jgi:hypothetical protein
MLLTSSLLKALRRGFVLGNAIGIPPVAIYLIGSGFLSSQGEVVSLVVTPILLIAWTLSCLMLIDKRF